MSTDLQQYSIKNQQDAIRRYAAGRGMEIVRTYADGGKSGVSIARRNALKQLIDDVKTNRADFDVIVVYDISRWGRFQDIDESAYYEYICRQAGIEVQYCAEPFSNDGSTLSAIIKGVKRMMAAEYSRELSVKVFAGQRRLIQLGYRLAGPAGFGLRRSTVNEFNVPCRTLARGEQKRLKTERIILVPGPREEIETVRWMYELFCAGKQPTEISRVLNQAGIKSDYGRPWTAWTVGQVLKNEKYIGNNVWNRQTGRMGSTLRWNPQSEWVRYDGAFAPVVDRKLFDAANVLRQWRKDRFTSVQMLKELKRLLDTHGKLTQDMITADPLAPCPAFYIKRFGSLRHAYSLVGFHGHSRRGVRGSEPIKAVIGSGAEYCAMG